MQQKGVKVDELLSSRLLVIAPHMDDEILGCGGLMLLHRDKQRLHCIYASDGAKSPMPLLPWQGSPAPDLPQIRAREAAEVLADIGVPPDNYSMLGFTDGSLARSARKLRSRLEREINIIGPDFIFVPFRYDLHTDHVAVHRAIRYLKKRGRISATILEYIIYFRWRLIEGGDIRFRISKARLAEVDISSVSSLKRSALSKYRSQTSNFYPWQETPILTEESIRSRCREPERFLISDSAEPLLACFSKSKYWILVAHYVERLGKRRKDQAVALLKWALQPLLRRKD